MRKTALLAAMALGVAAAGCVHSSVTRTATVAVPARAADCHLDVLFQGPPSRPYVVLGQVTTDSELPALFALGENDIITIRRLEEQACAAGAHGLMSVITSSDLLWAGRGQWRSTMGGALTFVYVDGAGRPLPAP